MFLEGFLGAVNRSPTEKYLVSRISYLVSIVGGLRTPGDGCPYGFAMTARGAVPYAPFPVILRTPCVRRIRSRGIADCRYRGDGHPGTGVPTGNDGPLVRYNAKAPLCKGSCHAVTEGLTRIRQSLSHGLRRASPLCTRGPLRAVEDAGPYGREWPWPFRRQEIPDRRNGQDRSLKKRSPGRAQCH